MKGYMYSDMEIYETPPEWKSDDYIVVDEKTTLKELLNHYGRHWQEAFNILREYLYGEEEYILKNQPIITDNLDKGEWLDER